MKISINRNGCIECGACQQTCSEVFLVENGQNAHIVEMYWKNAPDVGRISDTHVSCMTDALASCPVQVINAV